MDYRNVSIFKYLTDIYPQRNIHILDIFKKNTYFQILKLLLAFAWRLADLADVTPPIVPFLDFHPTGFGCICICICIFLFLDIDHQVFLKGWKWILSFSFPRQTCTCTNGASDHHHWCETKTSAAVSSKCPPSLRSEAGGGKITRFLCCSISIWTGSKVWLGVILLEPSWFPTRPSHSFVLWH